MTTKNEYKTLSSISGRKWLKNASVSKQVAPIAWPEESSAKNFSSDTTHLVLPKTVAAEPMADPVDTVSVEVPDVAALRSVPVSHAAHIGLGPAVDKAQPELSEILDNDISEKIADWAGDHRAPNSPRTTPPKEPKKDQPDPKNRAIEVLCDSIVERFPPVDRAVILFAGSEPNIHVDETCARVASCLAGRDLGRILLVDSDLKGRALSAASGLAKEQGILDVKERGIDWKTLVYGGSSTKLDFMPAGIGFKYCDLNKKSKLIKAVGEMKEHYQFVLVSVGDAHSIPARVWSDIGDGSYLLVSMKNSNETIAKSAVAELKTCGARLLGCVVTDAA